MQVRGDRRPRARAVMSGTPSFLKIILEKADELGVECRSIAKRARLGRGVPAGGCASSCSPRAARRIPGVRHRGLGRHRLRDAGARRAGGQRGRHRRDRASGHRRSGAPGRGGRGRRDDVQSSTTRCCASRTGDLSADAPGASPCGRTNLRIKGWMGRADQATKVAGMFVHPHQVAEVAAPPSGSRARAPRGGQTRGQRPHDAARRGFGDARRRSPRRSSRRRCAK